MTKLHAFFPETGPKIVSQSACLPFSFDTGGVLHWGWTGRRNAQTGSFLPLQKKSSGIKQTLWGRYPKPLIRLWPRRPAMAPMNWTPMSAQKTCSSCIGASGLEETLARSSALGSIEAGKLMSAAATDRPAARWLQSRLDRKTWRRKSFLLASCMDVAHASSSAFEMSAAETTETV